ncbi:RNA polymerase I-specific transcription initiation factor RRN3-like isoform X2 [Prunus avium]|uniref:RNA polymerase I-specific transcription initiation factor RRN3-like isoform X2 n=1 Tax=Prunus avium TaxID=42229 RepID=A0A6P5RTY4_PRUAV|nr:RNA polymerase I-specific transcription initiation factor RRN3-like isoform X2 [Prunus avium]XP_021804527.1 RNA polymerase I-specific transcription initiation factor RRN3-like isoform X2 [Prunus avium]
MGVVLRDDEAAFRKMGDHDLIDSYLVYRARDTLCSVSSADTEDYRQLLSAMNPEELGANEVAMLVTNLKALAGAVAYIDNVLHDELLSAISNMSLWNYKPDVMDALLEFIESLATSSGKYVDYCLKMLTCQFFPPLSLPLPKILARKDGVLSRVHSSLKYIADLVPLSPVRLVPIVLNGKPQYCFNTISTLSLVIYVENMFKLESGVLGEVVRIPMFAGVVDLLLELDVNIGWEDIENETSERIFEMELEDGDESRDDDSELPRKLSQKILGGNSFAEKLDSLMVLTFEHLESCQVADRLIKIFDTLLELFKKTILTTYKPKFAQFVIFYACSLDPKNCGVTFALMLEHTFFFSTDGPVLRMKAVAYLASYLSRAKFLSVFVIAGTLERLVDWCVKYVKMQDNVINPKAHRLFYSGCQAIMYVLCFRMRSMMDDPQLKPWLVRLPLESILNNKLSPLKVCLSSIVLEFLRQAKAARLFMTSEKFIFDDYLESELSREFGGTERLDMFFPFDPCLLEKSDSYIRPNFIFWSMVQPTYDDEDSSDEDVGEAFASDDDGGMDYGIMQSLEEQHFDFAEVGSALNKMSITPKDSLHSRFGGAINQPMRMPSRIRPSTSPESL